jgi:hypothetical protein
MAKDIGMTPESMFLFDKKIAPALYGCGTRNYREPNSDQPGAGDFLNEGLYISRKLAEVSIQEAVYTGNGTLSAEQYLSRLESINPTNFVIEKASHNGTSN